MKMNRSCEYQDAPSESNSNEFAALKQKLQHLERRLSLNDSITGSSKSSARTLRGAPSYSFPAIFFLDQDAFVTARLAIPRHTMSAPTDIIATLGSMHAITEMVEHYFSSVHNWLPIVSKKRLYHQLQTHGSELSVDLALLLLAMRLLVEIPLDAGSSLELPFYHATKQYLYSVEHNGSLTLKLLQAATLVAVYEMGHAIYPAAFLTIGHCARLGQAIGLHDKRTPAPQMISRPGTWTEQEEIRRTWWAVLLLDRQVDLHANALPTLKLIEG